MMQHSLSKHLGIALLSLGFTTSLSAQKVWNKNDGQWSTPGNWTGGVPSGTTGAANQSQFLIDSSSTNTSITVTIGAGVAATTTFIDVGLGKSVTLQMENGASLATSALWGVGTAIGTGSGAGHLTIKGPESGSATVTSGYFFVGRSVSSGGGNTLTFSGSNLVVNDTGTSASSVGRFTDNNTLVIENGAVVNRYALSLSPSNADAGRISNGAIVRGSQSKLALSGGLLQIGNTANARDNYLKVENNGTLEVKEQKAILIGAAGSFGGNHLEVSTGGKIMASGATTIYGYAQNGGDNGGANRLSILSGGTFASSSTITSSGLLQLEEGGVLKGEMLDGAPAALNITIGDGGRFEAEGEGLDKSVTATIQSGGTFAIGLTDHQGARQGPASLTLSSTVNLSSNTILEITIFAADPAEVDQITLATGGTLALNGNVTLKLVLDGSFIPQAGDSWTIFDGVTTGITGSFNLDALDPALWDTSLFNEQGNWQLRAIPEPRVEAALAFGSVLAILQLTLRRRKALPLC